MKAPNTVKRIRRGFTLVEVVVVLVVLAIIAAIMIPAMTGWIDEANAKRCLSQMGDVRRDYQAFSTYHSQDSAAAYSADDANRMLAEAVLEMTGENASGSSFPDGMDGTCTAAYSADKSAIADIYCSKHGSLSGGGASHQTRIENGISAMMSSKEAVDEIFNYFKNRNNTSTLDSGGPNYGVLEMQPILDKLNLPSSLMGYSITVDKNGKTFSVYWTDQDIQAKNVGDKVYCVKYTYSYDDRKKTVSLLDGEEKSGKVLLKEKTVKDTEGVNHTYKYMDVLTDGSFNADGEYGASAAD